MAPIADPMGPAVPEPELASLEAWWRAAKDLVEGRISRACRISWPGLRQFGWPRPWRSEPSMAVIFP
jgi:hypothetical protein